MLRMHNLQPFEHSLNPSHWLSAILEGNYKFSCITLWVFDVLVGDQWRCRRE